MNSPETSPAQPAHESINSQSKAATERSTELAKNRENNQKLGSERENTIDVARKAVAREAIAGKERVVSEKKSSKEPPFMPSRSNKNHRLESYKNTLSNIQVDMGKTSRTMSRIIHNPAIETASTVVGSTIARPRTIIYSSFTALVSVSLLYIAAKYFGYTLSGSETIATFLLGWLIGIVYETVTSVLRH